MGWTQPVFNGFIVSQRWQSSHRKNKVMTADQVCKKTRLMPAERIFGRHFYWIFKTLLPSTQDYKFRPTRCREDC
jgi:hypothetical protein